MERMKSDLGVILRLQFDDDDGFIMENNMINMTWNHIADGNCYLFSIQLIFPWKTLQTN